MKNIRWIFRSINAALFVHRRLKTDALPAKETGTPIGREAGF